MMTVVMMRMVMMRKVVVVTVRMEMTLMMARRLMMIASIRHVLILSQSVLQEPYVYEFIKPHSCPVGSKLLPSQFADKEAAAHCLTTVGRGRGSQSLRSLIPGSATCLLTRGKIYLLMAN